MQNESFRDHQTRSFSICECFIACQKHSEYLLVYMTKDFVEMQVVFIAGIHPHERLIDLKKKNSEKQRSKACVCLWE